MPRGEGAGRRGGPRDEKGSVALYLNLLSHRDKRGGSEGQNLSSLYLGTRKEGRHSYLLSPTKLLGGRKRGGSLKMPEAKEGGEKGFFSVGNADRKTDLLLTTVTLSSKTDHPAEEKSRDDAARGKAGRRGVDGREGKQHTRNTLFFPLPTFRKQPRRKKAGNETPWKRMGALMRGESSE